MSSDGAGALFQRVSAGVGGKVATCRTHRSAVQEMAVLPLPSGPEEGYQARKAGQSIEGDKGDKEEVDMGTHQRFIAGIGAALAVDLLAVVLLAVEAYVDIVLVKL